MTIDALPLERATLRRKETAVPHGVAGETSAGQRDRIALLAVYVVTGGARHTGLKASAAGQEHHLITVDVDHR